MVNDHYPYIKWLFHWGYTQHFQTHPFMFSDSTHRQLMMRHSFFRHNRSPVAVRGEAVAHRDLSCRFLVHPKFVSTGLLNVQISIDIQNIEHVAFLVELPQIGVSFMLRQIQICSFMVLYENKSCNQSRT